MKPFLTSYSAVRALLHTVEVEGKEAAYCSDGVIKILPAKYCPQCAEPCALLIELYSVTQGESNCALVCEDCGDEVPQGEYLPILVG